MLTELNAAKKVLIRHNFDLLADQLILKLNGCLNPKSFCKLIQDLTFVILGCEKALNELEHLVFQLVLCLLEIGCNTTCNAQYLDGIICFIQGNCYISRKLWYQLQDLKNNYCKSAKFVIDFLKHLLFNGGPTICIAHTIKLILCYPSSYFNI